MKNTKAQIGATITWIVATVIIVLILIISLFASSLLPGKSKSISFSKTADVLASKSLFSYLLTKDTEGKEVYEQIKDQKTLNEFNGNLGKDIFLTFYGSKYKEVWLGIVNLIPFSGEENSYFGKIPSGINLENTKVESAASEATESIQINKDKAIQIVLLQK